VEKKLLVLLSVALLGARLLAARAVGWGDSEALYACYALHPAPAYLDHPGLIGVFASLIGHGGAPLPLTAHIVTTVLATAVPWLAVFAARSVGASARGAFLAGIAVAVTPEIAVGLFAMTPDLLLALAWLGSLALVARATAREPSSLDAAASFVGAGVLAGAAASSKASGVLLIVALLVTYASPLLRKHATTLWPWAGLLAGLVIVLPVVSFEARTGWPMVHHRLVSTQAGAGPSLRNVAAVLGGQLAYLSPLLSIALVWLGVDLFRHRKDDAASTLLFHATAIPFVPLLVLSLWSRVAEPHWLAPALLALPLHYARRLESTDAPARGRGTPFVFQRRFARAAAGIALVMVALVHAWVLVPSLVRLAPASFDPRFDIANELFGWPDAVSAVEEIAVDESARGEIVIVGPHWIVCAQLHARLGSRFRVGCATPIPDDFDTWTPRETWRKADKIIYVTDARFETDPSKTFPDRIVARRSRITVLRGGRVARVFTLSLLERSARGEL
jgi:Dolichyl-phosphate-mannose-protein mannosyltransferase